MKLFIYDKGDPSVGLFQCEWEIDTPFDIADVDSETLNWFKKSITDLYDCFCTGRCVAEYDFEIEKRKEYEAKFIDFME